MRLQAFLARSGAAPSRRKAESLITSGRVEVNGRTATLGQGVEPETDRVLLDGAPVELPSSHAYLALNKPAGYLTTLHDDRGRPTVVSLMPQDVPGLVPVGRLDAGTTGLLLLTNDGALAHHITHPSSGIEKEYELTIRTPFPESSLKALAEGPQLEDGKMLPPELTDPRHAPGYASLNIIIHEGRNRIIRRACEAVGLRLLQLKRVRVGPVELDRLREGRYRALKRDELRGLGGGG